MNLNFPYKPKPWIMLAAVLFFAACALTGWHVHATQTDPLVVLGIRLAPDDARTVFGAMAAVSVLFVVGGIFGFVTGLRSSDHLTLTDQYISAPKYGFSRSVTTIPLADIQRIELQTIKRQRLLNIYRRNGRLPITQSFLPNAEAFEKVRSALAARAKSGA
ncbi:MAG TPA: hypothetical protein VFE61_00570 [Candidatus Sulfotelmatobacter sp.]|nr:hypothetical protein [Candidatus Sulfotelmatobacter sp.]